MRLRARSSETGALFLAVLSGGFGLPGFAGNALAKPEGPRVFCTVYPDAASCMGSVPDCTMCHVSTFPASWNAYGQALKGALAGQPFEQGLPAALATIEALDSDLDGVANRVEINAGTKPGDGASRPVATDAGVAQLPPNPDYDVGQYDVSFAYRRASVLYCGKSPAYEELLPFRDPAQGAQELKTLLHERIEQCLNGAYWLKEGLPRLADERIRPIRNLGQDAQVFITIPLPSLAGEVRLRSTMGDYRFDYRLWSYVLSGNRDARDLLLAQYFVLENADGSWSLTEELVDKTDETATAGGQRLEKPYRAGMITTQWFLTRNTMFTDLPRTTAAAAYRSYLGMDISKMQGLMPVAGEPDDIDDKGVDAPRCAACHSTLDPLAYAFAPYTGFEFDLFTITDIFLFGQMNGLFGVYKEDRAVSRMPRWSPEEQQPYLLGKKVDNLRNWAQVAAASDEFARNLANVFFMHAFSREAEAAELPEFQALWQSLRSDSYSANKLIHRIIDTQAFGAP
jgi:hypothetical protein